MRKVAALLAACLFIPAIVSAQARAVLDGLRFNVSSQTVGASGTVTPSKSYVELTCSDGGGCAVALSETNAREGTALWIVNVSANTATFADSAGVLEMSGGTSFAAAQYQSLLLQYIGDRWVEVARSGGGGGGGGVSSVALTVPAIFSVSGSPITSSGTLAVSFANATAKTFLGGPTSGSPAAPTLRVLGVDDLPVCASTKIYKSNGSAMVCDDDAGASSGAPSAAYYITQQADATLSNEQALSALSTGVVKVTTTTGVLSTATEGTDYYKPGGTDVAFADGGTGVSSASDDTTLVSNGSAWQAKAIPNCTDTGGNHLNYTTSSNTISCGTSSSGGGGGGMTLLEQYTASSSATLDFTTFISATYDTYVFQLLDVLPATSTADLWIRMGTGGGPTYDTGANYAWTLFQANQAGGTAALGAGGDTKLKIAHSLGNGATNGASGEITFYNPQSTAVYKRYVGQMMDVDSSGNIASATDGGQYVSTTAVTAIRFMFSSGNIASGTIRVYGIEK